MKTSLAELTEEAEGKILFACPGEFPGQAKRLFWRIGVNPEPHAVWGLSPILQKSLLFASSAPLR